MDFTEIKCMLDDVLSRFDHCFLNETVPFNEINRTGGEYTTSYL